MYVGIIYPSDAISIIGHFDITPGQAGLHHTQPQRDTNMRRVRMRRLMTTCDEMVRHRPSDISAVDSGAERTRIGIFYLGSSA